MALESRKIERAFAFYIDTDYDALYGAFYEDSGVHQTGL